MRADTRTVPGPQAMMTCGKEKMNFEEVLTAMVESLSDTKDRVRAASLEAAIVVDSCVGQNEFNHLLASLRVSSDVRKMISERKRSKRRPFINSEGFVEFQVVHCQFSLEGMFM